MTIGTVTGRPNNTFGFPRSYIYRLLFPRRLYPMLHAGPNFVFNELLFPQNTYYINIAANFWPWTSNSWTLDHVVAEAYATVAPSPVLIPAPVWIRYLPPSSTDGPGLSIDVFIESGPYNTVVIPPVDQPYWLAPL